MRIHIKIILLLLFLLLVSCDDDPAPVDTGVSFTQITNMWFEQEADASPPSPNGLEIIYDAEDNEMAFDNLLATEQSGEVNIQ